MNRKTVYTPSFFNFQSAGSLASARAILPYVMELIRPKSVIDVGCGTGEWLSVFQELGVPVVRGVDGDYVERSRLRIAPECFIPHDLSKPLALAETFDLAMSLEVAEHLPESAAANFVKTLVQLAPVVLFSAAIPFQSGTGHINEQWPEYWAELFANHGYSAYDCIRGRFWNHPEVSAWYAQNTLLYVREGAAHNYPSLPAPASSWTYPALTRIHHRLWLERADPEKMGGRAALRVISKVFMSKIRGLIRRSR